MSGPVEAFAEELDELIRKWRDKHEDDRLSGAEAVGCLYFAAHNIMSEMAEHAKEE